MGLYRGISHNDDFGRGFWLSYIPAFKAGRCPNKTESGIVILDYAAFWRGKDLKRLVGIKPVYFDAV